LTPAAIVPTITTNPLPTNFNPQEVIICQNGTAILTANGGTTGTTYTWYTAPPASQPSPNYISPITINSASTPSSSSTGTTDFTVSYMSSVGIGCRVSSLITKVTVIYCSCTTCNLFTITNIHVTCIGRNSSTHIASYTVTFNINNTSNCTGILSFNTTTYGTMTNVLIVPPGNSSQSSTFTESAQSCTGVDVVGVLTLPNGSVCTKPFSFSLAPPVCCN
jgi:hypothetical protein